MDGINYNDWTKQQLEEAASAPGDVAQAVTDHLAYRNALEAYANDLLSRAASGIGSNPPGNPPRPPGA